MNGNRRFQLHAGVTVKPVTRYRQTAENVFNSYRRGNPLTRSANIGKCGKAT